MIRKANNKGDSVIDILRQNSNTQYSSRLEKRLNKKLRKRRKNNSYRTMISKVENKGNK